MSSGVEDYLLNLQENDLAKKTEDGKLHIQLVYVNNLEKPIGFCITSLTKDKIGEIEALYVIDSYQKNKLGGKMFKEAMAWMEKEKAIEQRLVVATGNEKVFGFYAKYGFFPGYTILFRT
ncbi:MAG: GNAT family N-acetyltransferase [Xenococcaceae cyanobacterium MO_188.B32]|nr:GNAT family N-acetyltransferase [Xenococcaceae cyanobacterium MO_188.B32]